MSTASLAQYFPSLNAAGANMLAAQINTYLANPTAATQQTWSDLIDQLVGAAHQDIEREEWPRVVACALEQEYAWGRYKEDKAPSTPPVNTKKNFAWRRGRRKPDEILVSVAARALAKNNLPPFTPGAVAGRRFLEEIPDTVLQELGFLSLIRFGKSLTTSIKSAEIRKRVESNRFYRAPFGWLFPVFYRWARIRRTQPESVVILNTAIPIACLLFLAGVIAVLVLKVAWFSGTALTLLLIPTAVLGIWFYLFRR